MRSAGRRTTANASRPYDSRRRSVDITDVGTCVRKFTKAEGTVTAAGRFGRERAAEAIATITRTASITLRSRMAYPYCARVNWPRATPFGFSAVWMLR
jgi:hypothetical protein